MNDRPPALSRPIRVLQVIDTLSIGGAEQLLVTLARAVDRDRFDLRVIALRPPFDTPIARDLRDLEIPIHSVGAARIRDPRILRRFVGLVRGERVDVLHTHLGLGHSWGVVGGRLAGRPVVSTIHNIQNEAEPLGQVREALQRQALRRLATRVVACAPEVHSYARDVLGVAEHKIVDIPNGIDTSRFEAVDPERVAAVRHELLRDGPGPLIVAVGALQVAKGHQHLVDAMPAVLQRHPGATVVIVGAASDNEAVVRGRISSLGLQERVQLTGVRRDIPAIVAGADVFVLPSVREAMPLSLLEAMAAGTPVVASAVGGIPSVLRDGVNGRLAPPGDAGALGAALADVLSDAAAARTMGETGRRTVHEGYGAAVWARRLEALYRSVAG